MGAIIASLWINYNMRLFEPQYYGTPDCIEECLSLMELNGDEDKSFRQHVSDFVKNKFDGDNFHVNDKRVYNFLCKNMENKTSLMPVVKKHMGEDYYDKIMQIPGR